jgi:hypothetical protein
MRGRVVALKSATFLLGHACECSFARHRYLRRSNKDIILTSEQRVQSRLVLHGVAVPTDGDWVRLSIVALRDFQKRMGLAVTGVTDKTTGAALKSQPTDGREDRRPAPAETMPSWMGKCIAGWGCTRCRMRRA